jgi:hypothetical protein
VTGLASEESIITASFLTLFSEEFETHLVGACALRHDLIVPKLTDYVPGQGFSYDQEYRRKQPDWTFATD